MTLNSKIVNICKTLNLGASEDVYRGSKDKFVVFNYAGEYKDMFADDDYNVLRINVNVNLYVPLKFNYHQLKSQLRDELENNGFDINNVYTLVEPDTELRHIVFDTEYIQNK